MEEKFEKEYQFMPVGQLHESLTNPRKTWDPKKQEELEDSIKAKGILEPLLVRKLPKDGGYEVVVGGRRLRAAHKLGLKVVPVLVRDYNDGEIREVQLIENLQKEDMEPIDEADAYEELITQKGYNVDTIAERIGKNPTYVYRRYRLISLIPEAKDLLRQGKLGLMHSLELCRIQATDQRAALERIKRDDFQMASRDLRNWIESEVFLDLHSAPFKKNDPDLVKEAGPCTECPKRSGFIPALFPDIKKKDTCTDPACFHKKMDIYIKGEMEARGGEILKLSREWDFYGKEKERPKDVLYRNHYRELPKGEKPCGFQKDGIVISGDGLGTWLTVCADPSCKVHYGRPGRVSKSPGEREAAKKERLDQKVKNQSRMVLLDEVKKMAPIPLEGEVLLAVIHKTFSRVWHEHKKKIVQHLGWEITKRKYGTDYDESMVREVALMNDKDRYRFLLEIAFINDTETIPMDAGRDNTSLGNIARFLNISPKEIEKEMRKALDPKAKQKELPKPVKSEEKKEKKVKNVKSKKKGGKK